MTNSDKVDILIVDDLPEKLLVLDTVLDDPGINVITARSGADALRHVLERDFAVVLLDVNMPGMDGFETAALIRKRHKSAHTPIIFITAFADEIHAAQGYSLGAVDFILAPILPDVLRTKVKVFVDLFRMAQQAQRQADERVALAREQAARLAAEETTRRSTFLAEASRVLATSLDYDATVASCLRFLLPFLGDLAALALVDENGRPRQWRIVWLDANRRSWDRVFPATSDWCGPLAEVFERAQATGKTNVWAPAGEQPLPIPAWESLGLQLGSDERRPEPTMTAAVLLPLLARGRTWGCLLLAMGPSGRSYAPADVTLAEDLAGRAGVALDNARLYRDIQDADARKNEFLAMLSHELRNPLAPIRNAVEILRRRGSDPVTVAKTQDLIDRQVQHLVRLVDDLLDISRITRGKIQLQTSSVAVADVVARAVETSHGVFQERGHTLEVALPDKPILVNGDSVRLAQVIGNLLTNAAKYTEPRGRVWLSVVRSDDTVVIRVRDTGVGIPREMLACVFDLFTQVDRSLDRSQGGLGIGLTLVRQLVEMHGGTVQAFSAGPGLGSEFVVSLPVLEAVELPAASFTSDGELDSPCPHRRVLVAEDDPVSAMSLEWVLQEQGHEVFVCHDGPAVLKAVDTFQPEIVLLDIGLPGMDGYKVASQLRQRLEGQKPMLVALTGYGQEEDRRRARDSGFDHHLIKPVDHRVLQELFLSYDATGSVVSPAS